MKTNKVINSREEIRLFDMTCEVKDFVIDPTFTSIMRWVKPDAKFEHVEGMNKPMFFFHSLGNSSVMLGVDDAKALIEGIDKLDEELDPAKVIWVGRVGGLKRTFKLSKRELVYHNKDSRKVVIIPTPMNNWGPRHPTSKEIYSRLRTALKKFIEGGELTPSIPYVDVRGRVEVLFNRSAGFRYPIIVQTCIGPYSDLLGSITIRGGTRAPSHFYIRGLSGETLAESIDLYFKAIDKVAGQFYFKGVETNPNIEPVMLRGPESELKLRRLMEYVNVSSRFQGAGEFNVFLNGDYSDHGTKWSFIYNEDFVNNLKRSLTTSVESINALPTREEAMINGKSAGRFNW